MDIGGTHLSAERKSKYTKKLNALISAFDKMQTDLQKATTNNAIQPQQKAELLKNNNREFKSEVNR